jgi:hypothetical protein
MVAKNDITGDSIQTKHASSQYRNNYDLIFKKKETVDKKENLCQDKKNLEKKIE